MVPRSIYPPLHPRTHHHPAKSPRYTFPRVGRRQSHPVRPKGPLGKALYVSRRIGFRSCCPTRDHSLSFSVERSRRTQSSVNGRVSISPFRCSPSLTCYTSFWLHRRHGDGRVLLASLTQQHGCVLSSFDGGVHVSLGFERQRGERLGGPQ